MAAVDALDAAAGSWYRPAPVLTGQHEHLEAADLEEAMAFSITCADSGAKCPGKFVTESEKELMEHVKIHMAASHPEMLKNPPPPEALKKMIRKV